MKATQAAIARPSATESEKKTDVTGGKQKSVEKSHLSKATLKNA